MVEHQQKHLRIEKLRQTAGSLDETIKTSIRLLAETRKEIQAIPSSEPNTSRREVKVDELLSYAKFISKTTVPPTLRQPLPDDLLRKPVKSEKQESHKVNGAATPNETADVKASNGNSGNNPAYARSENIGVQAMEERDKAWLEAAGNLPFEPWPSHGVIQNGALAKIQRMLENGQDPASVLTAEEQAEEDRKKKEQEEREREEQEERVRRRMSVFDTGRRRVLAEDEVFNPDDL